ncbi:hypothetical protein ACDZ94_26765 (plasmid) [Pseudomonas sp. UBT]|uniref:hypothetical protein n=1 Tax=Pseudomonas sp. UBT TaxID=3239198 RepID=UPI003D8040AA
MNESKVPDWIARGKTISQLIKELKTFENQNFMVEISVDGGATKKPISFVGKEGGVCVLLNCESEE